MNVKKFDNYAHSVYTAFLKYGNIIIKIIYKRGSNDAADFNWITGGFIFFVYICIQSVDGVSWRQLGMERFFTFFLYVTNFMALCWLEEKYKNYCERN